MYKRKKNAPEPYKFMGHGACDILHHSLNLPFLTHSAKVIEPIIQAKVQKLAIPPEEVRGASIQLQKCQLVGQREGENDGNDASPFPRLGTTNGLYCYFKTEGEKEKEETDPEKLDKGNQYRTSFSSLHTPSSTIPVGGPSLLDEGPAYAGPRVQQAPSPRTPSPVSSISPRRKGAGNGGRSRTLPLISPRSSRSRPHRSLDPYGSPKGSRDPLSFFHPYQPSSSDIDSQSSAENGKENWVEVHVKEEKRVEERGWVGNMDGCVTLTQAWKKTDSMLEEEVERKQILDPWSLAAIPQSILMDVVADDLERLTRIKEDRVGRHTATMAARREARRIKGHDRMGPIFLPQETEPRLGGHSTLEGIRALLREWIEERGDQGPQREEVDECTYYFFRLVHFGDLYRARVLRRSLHSMVERLSYGSRNLSRCKQWKDLMIQVDESITRAVRSRRGNERYWVDL